MPVFFSEISCISIHIVYVCDSITVIDFPTCIIGDHQELTAENLASFFS